MIAAATLWFCAALGLLCPAADRGWPQVRHEMWDYTAWHRRDIALNTNESTRSDAIEFTYRVAWWGMQGQLDPQPPCHARLTAILHHAGRMQMQRAEGDGLTGIVVTITTEHTWRPIITVIAERCLNNPSRLDTRTRARLALLETLR